MSKLNGEEKVGIGCMALIVLFNIVWIGFLIWAIYSIVSWLVTK